MIVALAWPLLLAVRGRGPGPAQTPEPSIFCAWVRRYIVCAKDSQHRRLHNLLSHGAPCLHNSRSDDASYQRPRPPLALPCGSLALAPLAVAMAMGVQGGGVCPEVHSSAVFSPLQVALSVYMSQGLQHLLRLLLYTACSLLLLTEAEGSSIDVGEIFVGNLDFRLRKADVVCAFSQWGQVVEVYERF